MTDSTSTTAPVETKPVKATKPVKPKSAPETAETAHGTATFAEYRDQLSKADAAAAAAGKRTAGLKEKVQGIAVDAILSAFAEHIDGENARVELVDAGVLKGTASKIGTVITALHEGIIQVDQVESLSGAYGIVRAHRAAAQKAKEDAANEITSKAAQKAGTVKLAEEVRVATPEEAFQIVLNTVRGEEDIDKAFELAGSWMTRLTTELKSIMDGKRAAGE